MDNAQRWLENLQKAAPVATASRPSVITNPLFQKIVAIETEDTAGVVVTQTFGGDDISSDVAHVADGLFQPHIAKRDPRKDGRFDSTAYFSSTRDDEALVDASWDELISGDTKKPDSKKKSDFSEDSDARFQKVCAIIQRIFAGREEEAAEAIELAKQMRADARAAVIAFEDGEPLSKSTIQSGMQRQFAEVRASCSREEETQILKAIKALDLSAFFELLESVKSRLAA